MKFNKEWSKQDEQKYTWLYNYVNSKYENIYEISYIDDMKRQLMSIIESNENWSISSKESLLFMVAKYLKLFGSSKYAKLYSAKGFEYLQIRNNNENENKQDDKEIINYRPQEYFIKILDSIKYEDIKTVNGHYQYLLLSLLVLQPPLRTNYYTSAQFITKKDDNDHKNNFIWITKRGSLKCYFIVNNDKVSSTKTYSINKNLSTIEIENKKLCEIINNSFIKYPRTFLFEINNKQITQNTLLNWLRKITNVNELNIDMMRSSYINNFYDINNKTMKDKEHLSNQMRHSVLTAQKNYLKIDKILTDEKKEEKIDELQNKIYELQSKLNSSENIKIDDKKINKQRRDVIYALNIKGVNPRESTLIKYNIKFDETNNMFV